MRGLLRVPRAVCRLRPLVRNFSTPLTKLSEDEEMMRATVEKFSRETILPKVMEMDAKAEMPPELIKALFDNGLMSIEIEPEFGGSGMSFIHACLAIEEISKVDPGTAVMVDVHNTLVVNAVRRYGNDAQKKKYLPMLAKDTVASFCLSEASSGSDAFALKTQAIKKGDHYVLRGNKLWISNAKDAGLFLVFANIDPSKGYKGITAFLVERGAKGLTIGKKEDKLGIRASSTCEVSFDDVEVPVENVLGQPGQGYKVAIGQLNEGRVGIAAQLVGLAEGAFNNVLPYLSQRKQFGVEIGSFQGMQFQVAEVATRIEAARLLMLNAARLVAAGENAIKEASMAKLYASEVAEYAASKAVEWMGGIGFVRGMAEKFYRDAKIGSIYEGTSNMQKQTIAKAIYKEAGFNS